MNKWIKTTDRLPNRDRAVMFWDAQYKTFEFGYFDPSYNEWYDLTGQRQNRDSRITHWMDAEAPTS